jgi:hypothetical protein
MLVMEFEQKTALVQADLHAKFHSYRCPEKGDIKIHLNRLRQMHQDLQNIGVLIEDRDYAAILMQSLPSSYADFVANIAAAAQLVQVELTVDKLQHQLEQEFDRRKTHQNRQSHQQNQQSSQTNDTAYAANSSDRSSERSQRSGDQGRGDLRCWNCDGIGHIRSKCPSPRLDKGKEREVAEQKLVQESANVVDDSEIIGSWMAIPEEWDEETEEENKGVIWLTEVAEDDLGSLDSDEELDSVSENAMVAMDRSMANEAAESLQPAVSKDDELLRTVDLHDLEATCHMLPERECFLTHHEIARNRANERHSCAIETRDAFVNVSDKSCGPKFRLSGVPYAPQEGTMPTPVSRVDRAKETCSFSGGVLEISDPNSKKIEQVPYCGRPHDAEDPPGNEATTTTGFSEDPPFPKDLKIISSTIDELDDEGEEDDENLPPEEIVRVIAMPEVKASETWVSVKEPRTANIVCSKYGYC